MSTALEQFQQNYELERQWELRSYLGRRAEQRHTHQYWMYYHYAQFNWRSMTPEEATIVWPKEVNKPLKKH